jgi:hypothetical protein
LVPKFESKFNLNCNSQMLNIQDSLCSGTFSGTYSVAESENCK